MCSPPHPRCDNQVPRSHDNRNGSPHAPLPKLHTPAPTSFSSSCASRCSMSAVAFCTASEPSMVPSITASAGHRARGLYRPEHPPPPARRLHHELTGPILHLPPPPVTFTSGSPREQGEPGWLPLPQLLAIEARGHSALRAELWKGACSASVLSAWD